MNIQQSVYPFTVDGHLGCFQLLAAMNHAATQNLILNVDPNLSYVVQNELPSVSGIKAISFILKKEFRSFKK